MSGGDESYYRQHLVYAQASEQAARIHLASYDSRINRDLFAKIGQGRALDIGCGYGAFVALATQAGMDAYGVDFNEEQIDLGRRTFHLGERLQVGDVDALPSLYIEAGYDLITMFEVIEHVANPRALVSQAHRLLKPGGILALSCPNEARWQPAGRIFVDYPPHHLTRWRPSTLTRLLSNTGFADVRIDIETSVRDLLWTAYVNRSAVAKQNEDVEPSNREAPHKRLRNWKHMLFAAAGILFKPADMVLHAMRVGTMGMRVYARKQPR